MRRHGWPLGFLIAALLLALAGTALAANDEAPSVTSVAATDITATSATLQAYVNPENHDTNYFFEYGTSTAYGSESAPASAGNKDATLLVATAAGALAAGTTYHYRVVATNSKGTTSGSDRAFTTLEEGEVPPAGGGPTSPTDPSDPTSGQPGDPAQGDTPAGPKLGSSVTVEPGTGVVRVRRPGSSSFTMLEGGSELPVGSEVNALDGSIVLTSALPSGGIQTGQFGGGRFLIRQSQRGVVDLYLRGAYCSSRASAASAPLASAARRSRSTRTLWGRDHGGRFRTHGRNSHATVRGTRWRVSDRCDGTLTRVTSGSVVVRDTVRNKSVVVKAGGSYLARPRR
jgi:hypothetical protein